jgi:hypothetical protein
MLNREPASDCRDCVEVGLVFAPLAMPPPIDCLLVGAPARVVVEGGPMRDFPVVLNLDLVLESDVRAVVAGVPVRGVEAAELAEDSAGFVGDLVGD